MSEQPSDAPGGRRPSGSWQGEAPAQVGSGQGEDGARPAAAGWGDLGPEHLLWGETAPTSAAADAGPRTRATARPGIADLVDGAIRAIRTNIRPVLLSTALVVTVLTVLNLLVLLPLAGWLLARLGLDAATVDQRVLDARTAGEATVLVGLGETGSRVLVLGATLLVSGLLAPALVPPEPGPAPGPVSTRRLLSTVLPRLGALVGTAAAVTAGVLLGVVLGAVPGLVLATGGGTVAVLLGALLALTGGFTGFVLALLVWGVRTCLAPQCAVLAGHGVRASLQRSAALVRGRYWYVLGVLALGTLLTWVVQGVVSAPFATINAAVASAPDAELATMLGLSPLQLAITGVGVVVSTTLAFPVLAAVLTALYDALVAESGPAGGAS